MYLQMSSYLTLLAISGCDYIHKVGLVFFQVSLLMKTFVPFAHVMTASKMADGIARHFAGGNHLAPMQYGRT